MQAQIPPLSGVSERCAIDMLHQLRQSLGEKSQVDFVPDVVFGPLEQVQQGLQEGTQLWMAERKQRVRKFCRITSRQRGVNIHFAPNLSSSVFE